jgi:hypothetical protein
VTQMRPFSRSDTAGYEFCRPLEKLYRALVPTVIHGEERATPKSGKKIERKLIADLPRGIVGTTCSRVLVFMKYELLHVGFYGNPFGCVFKGLPQTPQYP